MQRTGDVASAGGRAAHEPRGRWAIESILVAAVMLLCTEVFAALVHAAGKPDVLDATSAPVPWIPFGISVAALLYRGLSRWPGVFVGTFADTLLVAAFPWPVAVVQAGVATGTAIGICTLLQTARVNPALERWHDPLLLWLAAGCGAAVLASIGVTVLPMIAVLGSRPEGTGIVQMLLTPAGLPHWSPQLLRLAGSWWANWTSGVALVLPPLRLLGRATWRPPAGRVAEAFGFALILVAWALTAYMPLPWIAGLPLCLVALVLVTWSAIRFRAPVATLVMLLLALIASATFIAGRGPLQGPSEQSIVVVWSFVALVSVTGMLIVSLLAERDTAAREQAASEARYRILFDSNPQPLWVQDPLSRHILMANAAAVRLYGYSREEFARLSAADLEASAPPDAGPDHMAALSGPDEYVHATRDGGLLTVELRSRPIDFDGRPATLVFSYDVTDRNRLRSAFIGATDRAARLLGQELHDGLGQELVGLSLITRSQLTRASRGEATELESLETIDRIAQRAVAACRNIAHGLSALAETGGSLTAALTRLPDSFDAEGMPTIVVDIASEAELLLAEPARDHVYRIAQEAISNAVKHAQARTIHVRLVVTPIRVVLTVRDDGTGLRRGAGRGAGLGFSSMQHRADAIGARLYVFSPVEGGTEIRLECPQADSLERDRAPRAG
jgi:PAS domain S-box-containing protein